MALPASRVGVASDQVDFEGKIIGGGGGGAVSSVNGKTGTVVLTATDVHALPDTTEIPVQSVNGQTGEVVLSASDVSALPDTTTIPSTAEDLTFNVQTEYSEGTVGKELSALNNSLTKLITVDNGTTNATVNTTSTYAYPSGVSKSTHALVCAEVLCSGNWRSDQLANVYMGDNGLACAPISSVATSQPLRIVYVKIS